MFLRYESFRQYIRLYPANTAILFLLAIVHAGFAIASIVFSIPTGILKQVYGGFIKTSEFAPEYWRYVTSAFLHADFGHLLMNGFALFVFAPPLERVVGSFRYAMLFLFSGIAGNIFTTIFYDSVFSLGASGAVYGVFGAYMYYVLFHRKALDGQSRQTLVTIVIIGVIYSVIVPRVNLYAHLGGFLGGFALNLLYTKILLGRYR